MVQFHILYIESLLFSNLLCVKKGTKNIAYFCAWNRFRSIHVSLFCARNLFRSIHRYVGLIFRLKKRQEGLFFCSSWLGSSCSKMILQCLRIYSGVPRGEGRAPPLRRAARPRRYKSPWNTTKSLKSDLKMRLERFKNRKFSYPGEGDTPSPGPHTT